MVAMHEGARPATAHRLLQHGPTSLVTRTHGGRRKVMAAAVDPRVISHGCRQVDGAKPNRRARRVRTGELCVRVRQGHSGGGSPQTIAATASPMASDAVRPGDSMPNSCTTPAAPCCAGPSMRKSPAGSPGPLSLGRMPL